MGFYMSKSKFFRVATEGATCDGRVIKRSWIEQMAKNYSPSKYGARVWVEHLRGTLPDSPFKAQGDVLAVEARTVEDGKLALFAEISPTEELVNTIKSRQKVYTSIEVIDSFADTNEAYLVGLAVTDSPASLGTEMLKFSVQSNNNQRFSTEATETVIELIDGDEEKPSILERVKGLFKQHSKETKVEQDDNIIQALTPVAEAVAELDKKYESSFNEMKKENEELRKQLTELTAKLSSAPETQDGERGLSVGGDSVVLTDC